MAKKAEENQEKGTKGTTTDATRADVVQELMDILGAPDAQGGKVQVYRKRIGKRDQYLDQLEAEGMRDDPLGMIREQFGGGEFVLVLRDSNARYVPNGRLQVAIAGPKKDFDREARNAPDLEDDDDERLRVLEERFERRLQEARGMSSGEAMRELLREIRELRAAVRNPPPGAEQANPADMALSMVQAMQTATAPLLTALLERKEERPMDTFLEAVKLVRELGAPPADNGFGSVLREVAQPFSRLVNAHVSRQEQAMQPNPPAGAAAPAGAEPDRPSWWPTFGSAIPQLLGWAAAGKSPEVYADFLVEEVPDHLLGPIYEEVSRGDDFIREFHAAVPAAANHADWFARLFARMLEQIEPVDDGTAAGPATEVGTGPPPPPEGV